MQTHTRIHRLLTSLLGVGLILLAAASHAECRLRVGWDDWPPYIVYENGEFQGLEYDLLIATADAAGCEIEMLRVPWVRALKMLENRSLDLLYGAGYSKERAAFAKYSLPYRQEQFVLMTLDNTPSTARSVSLGSWIQSAPGNRGRNLGLFRGDFYGKKMERVLEDNQSAVKLIRLGSNEQMVEMLARGRLDGFVIEDSVAQMLLKTSDYPLKRLIIQEQVTDPLHYLFSRDVPDAVVERFNAVIRKHTP
ncbi:transporter substrate-binding domain-containing protein [Marinobacter sp. NFXS9]|uniref:substrate-binding periplasmic protein n=1 Tax=Marinobacter sp. NFXS9 TaxID=2818433 RepID=UPI0032DEC9EF